MAKSSIDRIREAEISAAQRKKQISEELSASLSESRAKAEKDVERAKEEDKEWSYYDNWYKENKNTNRAMSNRTLYVDGGYYYRVRCTHAANSDVSSSFTDGIYID